MITQQILKDRTFDARLLDEGYAVIPFLNESEVKRLSDFYYSHHPDTLAGIYATAHSSDISLRGMMNDEIQKTVYRASMENFTDHKILGGSFIAKGLGSSGILNPHQDWNIVDEELYRSFNIWIPLVDLNASNGPICVFPGSHTWLKTYRSANINSAYSHVNKYLWNNMLPLHMKGGEALVYDHRLLHASGENTTGTQRLTAVVGMIPVGAQMYYYHKASNHSIEVFESHPDFFLLGNIFEGPKGLKSLCFFDFDFPEVNLPTLQTFINSKTYKSKKKIALRHSEKHFFSVRHG